MQKVWNVLPLTISLGLIGLISAVGRVDVQLAWAAVPGRCIAPVEVWAEGMTASLASYGNREFRRARVSTHIDLVGLAEVVRLEGEEQLKWGIDPGGDEMVVVYFSTRERSQGSVTTDGSLEWAYALFLARTEAEEPWQTVGLRIAPAAGELLAPTDVSRGPVAMAIDAWQEQGCVGLEMLTTE